MALLGLVDGDSATLGVRPETRAAIGDSVRIRWAMRSDVGYRRTRNEDSAVSTGTVFVVADGMGGHAAGDLASAAVVQQFDADDLQYPVAPEDIYETLTRASESVARISEAAARDAGTTVTGVALTEVDSVVSWLVFNIGDSRVYAEWDGQLVQVTRDHSVVGELVARGEITPEQAEFHPDRNQILKAVGFDMDPVPDFWSTPANVGMRILLCSDGLTKEVGDAQISQILSASPVAADAADQLVRAALESGGSDNVTVVVIDSLPGADSDGSVGPDFSASEQRVTDSDSEDTAPRVGS